MHLLAAFLIFVAIIMLWLARRQRRVVGLPGGKLISSDTSHWGALEKPLYSAALGLTGKPDYLVEQGDQLIPVEVKSSVPSQGPYDSHIYQLAAYCLLVMHVHGKRPRYGILHYAGRNQPGRTYAVDFTHELESAVLDIVQEMQSLSLRKGMDRSHNSPARCSRCGFRGSCDQVIH